MRVRHTYTQTSARTHAHTRAHTHTHTHTRTHTHTHTHTHTRTHTHPHTHTHTHIHTQPATLYTPQAKFCEVLAHAHYQPKKLRCFVKQKLRDFRVNGIGSKYRDFKNRDVTNVNAPYVFPDCLKT